MLLALKRLLSNIESVELVGAFQTASEALAFIKGRDDVDLAFLDIKIADDNGLELARSLRSFCLDIDIVFITSHSDFAFEAYDVYPLDYMVKPISRMRLAQSIAKAVSRRGVSLGTDSGFTSNRLTIRGFGCLDVSSEQAGTLK